MILPKCRSLRLKGMKFIACDAPAEYWDCSDPIGGPVCFAHACKRCGGKNGQLLSVEELESFVAEQEKK